MGVDGLLIEAHPSPDRAKSDSQQQIDLDHLAKLYHSIHHLASAIDLQLI
jgi:3-deoxy-7-phosphoheptulonate synthase